MCAYTYEYKTISSCITSLVNPFTLALDPTPLLSPCLWDLLSPASQVWSSLPCEHPLPHPQLSGAPVVRPAGAPTHLHLSWPFPSPGP